MDRVTEQRPDGQPAPGQQPPGSQMQPAQPGDPQRFDPEQLRQFQQFQQFQEFLRYQEAQRSSGADLVPSAQYPPAPTGTREVEPRRPARPRVPGWLRWLGKKVLGWLIFFLLLAIALTWAYNHFFGGEDEGDSTEAAAKLGGGTYHTNEILSDQPHEAVRGVYDAIAQVDPSNGEPLVAQACGRFDRATQQQFARNLGYGDCRQAVLALNKQVTHVNDYAESIYPRRYDQYSPSDQHAAGTVRIDSCEFPIKGGPALGTFTVTEQDFAGQWLITGHEPGPKTCPAPSSGSTGSPN
ncbi:hypothetical protein ACFS2C_00645 [Prauserella oleivorans]|uniref:Uncharacterized protein n=1 Tax=Prauserella oleivorans TaxID=1478153 RepID=A0ABW5W433_9PSEU